MTYTIVYHPDIEEIFRKMRKKDSARFKQLVRKLRELGENPEIGKPLRSPMQGLRRLHIGHHVLTYKLDKKKEQITLVDFAHHDDVY
ncbi:MAG: type II toxin-antitoxin system RelE family toxin [Methanoregula sp.]